MSNDEVILKMAQEVGEIKGIMQSWVPPGHGDICKDHAETVGTLGIRMTKIEGDMVKANTASARNLGKIEMIILVAIFLGGAISTALVEWLLK